MGKQPKTDLGMPVLQVQRTNIKKSDVPGAGAFAGAHEMLEIPSGATLIDVFVEVKTVDDRTGGTDMKVLIGSLLTSNKYLDSTGVAIETAGFKQSALVGQRMTSDTSVYAHVVDGDPGGDPEFDVIGLYYMDTYLPQPITES